MSSVSSAIPRARVLEQHARGGRRRALVGPAEVARDLLRRRRADARELGREARPRALRRRVDEVRPVARVGHDGLEQGEVEPGEPLARGGDPRRVHRVARRVAQHVQARRDLEQRRDREAHAAEVLGAEAVRDHRRRSYPRIRGEPNRFARAGTRPQARAPWPSPPRSRHARQPAARAGLRPAVPRLDGGAAARVGARARADPARPLADRLVRGRRRGGRGVRARERDDRAAARAARRPPRPGRRARARGARLGRRDHRARRCSPRRRAWRRRSRWRRSRAGRSRRSGRACARSGRRCSATTRAACTRRSRSRPPRWRRPTSSGPS